MHCALLIPEVLCVIFGYTASAAAACCARVHRTWQGEALNALWTSVDGIDVFREVLGLPNGRGLTLVTDKQRDRFMWYANRVRALTLAGHLPLMELQSSLVTMGTYRHTSHLLPNLVELSVHSKDILDRLPVVQLFLRSTLQRLTVQVNCTSDGERSAIATFFAFVPRRAPRVNHLTIKCSADFLQVHHTSVSRIIANLPELTVLQIHPAAIESVPSLVRTLARCPKLCAILPTTDWINDGMLSPLTVHPLVDARLSNLTEVTLAARLPPLCQILKSSFFAGRLRKLHILWNEHPVADFVANLTLAVGARCKMLEDFALVPANDLDKLGIAVATEYALRSLESYGTVTSTSLDSLCECRKMTHFKLHIVSPLAFYQEDVASLATSWPGLRVCDIAHCAFQPSEWCMTFGDLMEFGRSCRSLETLNVFVNPSVLPAYHDRAAFGCLRRLCLFINGPISDVAECVAFLTGVTSPFCDISYGGSEWPESPEVQSHPLSAVLALVPSIRAAYKQWRKVEAGYMDYIRSLQQELCGAEDRYLPASAAVVPKARAADPAPAVTYGLCTDPIQHGQRYKLINVVAGTVLTLSGRDGKAICGYPFHGGDDQIWMLENGGDQWTLQTRSGRFLCFEGWARNDTVVSTVDTPHQWAIVLDQNKSAYRILFPQAALCVDLFWGKPAPGTTIHLIRTSPNPCQLWHFVPA